MIVPSRSPRGAYLPTRPYVDYCYRRNELREAMQCTGMLPGDSLPPVRLLDCKIQCNYFVHGNRGNIEVNHALLSLECDRFPCHQERCLPHPSSLGDLYSQTLDCNRNHFAPRSLHHHGICKVYKMHCHRVSLSPHRDVDDSLSFHTHGCSLIRCPNHCVAQEFGMVDVKHLPECAINISRKIDHTAAT